MNTNLLDFKFARIVARLKVADRPTRRVGWHQVVRNTEGHSKAKRNVAFLD